MFKSLMTKKLNKKGFTLAELLVVVAILAILVAISVPIFTSRINEARKTTDLANMRAAKAAALAEYLDDGDAVVDQYYDADNGELKGSKAGIKPYGQSSEKVDGTATDTAPNNKVLKVNVSATGDVTLAWE